MALQLLPGACDPSCCPNTRGVSERDPSATPAPPPLGRAKPQRQQLQCPSLTPLATSRVPGRVLDATLAALQPLPLAPGSASSAATVQQHPAPCWPSGDTKQHTVLLLCQVGTLFFVVVGVLSAIFSESAKEAALKMGQIWIILFFPAKSATF